MAQTFKRLKITDVKGNVKHIPLNNTNLKFNEDYKKNLSKEKREKFLIETVELSVEEASAIGIAEAYAILHPPAKKSAPQANNNDMLIKLMEQNQQAMEQNAKLMERLAALEKPPIEDDESKPVKKK